MYTYIMSICTMLIYIIYMAPSLVCDVAGDVIRLGVLFGLHQLSIKELENVWL